MCLWLLSSTWTCWWKLRPPDLGRSWIGFEARQNMSVFVYSRQLKSAACQGPKRYEIGIIWAIADTLLPIRRWWLFLSGTDIGRHKNTDCPYISWFKAGILYYKILIQRREDLVKIFILSCSANVSKARQVDGVASGMLPVLRIILKTGNIIGNNKPVILIISAFYCPLAE